MSEQSGDEKLSGPGAGLSATGTTADQMEPGQESAGDTYGDPSGTGGAEREVTGDLADQSVGDEGET